VLLSVVYFKWATFSAVYFCLVPWLACSNFDATFLYEIFELIKMMMMIYLFCGLHQ